MSGKPIDGVVQALIEVAVGKVQHLYRGTCPDAIEGFDSRDPQCPACRVLTAAQQQGLRIVEPIRNCATPESREAAMVVLETDAEGNPTIWCDPEIADLVRALNVGGVRTKASCSGHGEKPFGIVSLQDGRELLVLPDWETTRRAERILNAGLSAQQQGQAVELAPPSAPVGVEAVRGAWLAAITLANNICVQESDRENDRDGDTAWIDGTAECAKRIREYAHPTDAELLEMLDEAGANAAKTALAQQPAALDEAMVERAWVAFCENNGSARQGIRAALTAALATQHQEPKS